MPWRRSEKLCRTHGGSPRQARAGHTGRGVVPGRDAGRQIFLLAKSMQTVFSRFLQDESGVTAIGYGLIAALISVVVIGSLTAVGTSLNAVHTAINTALTAAF